ncbi:MAG TPA: plastocyanin/azurin family copper-binding protein [Thermoleophilaceae bacterium]|jgi:plastocyanin
MRLTRFAIPLALLVTLVSAAPAAAFDWQTDVVDFEFKPAERRIAPGDSVTWTFQVAGHTTVSARGQADRWKSIDEGANEEGTTYTHVFNTPGRFQYYCVQHKDFMKGVVQVGTDDVVDSIDAFKSKRTGKRVKLSFKLNEAATVTYKLKGPSRRTVKRGRLDAGRHSFTVKRLKRGSYRGVLTVVDDFDKKLTPRNSFVIR